MLEIKDLHVNYGAVHALNGVSMTVNDGEIVSLIGANGAGKTTTLRTITGLEKAASGSITFDGHGEVGIIRIHGVPSFTGPGRPFSHGDHSAVAGRHLRW